MAQLRSATTQPRRPTGDRRTVVGGTLAVYVSAGGRDSHIDRPHTVTMATRTNEAFVTELADLVAHADHRAAAQAGVESFLVAVRASQAGRPNFLQGSASSWNLVLLVYQLLASEDNLARFDPLRSEYPSTDRDHLLTLRYNAVKTCVILALILGDLVSARVATTATQAEVVYVVRSLVLDAVLAPSTSPRSEALSGAPELEFCLWHNSAPPRRSQTAGLLEDGSGGGLLELLNAWADQRLTTRRKPGQTYQAPAIVCSCSDTLFNLMRLLVTVVAMATMQPDLADLQAAVPIQVLSMGPRPEQLPKSASLASYRSYLSQVYRSARHFTMAFLALNDESSAQARREFVLYILPALVLGPGMLVTTTVGPTTFTQLTGVVFRAAADVEAIRGLPTSVDASVLAVVPAAPCFGGLGVVGPILLSDDAASGASCLVLRACADVCKAKGLPPGVSVATDLAYRHMVDLLKVIPNWGRLCSVVEAYNRRSPGSKLSMSLFLSHVRMLNRMATLGRLVRHVVGRPVGGRFWSTFDLDLVARVIVVRGRPWLEDIGMLRVQRDVDDQLFAGPASPAASSPATEQTTADRAAERGSQAVNGVGALPLGELISATNPPVGPPRKQPSRTASKRSSKGKPCVTAPTAGQPKPPPCLRRGGAELCHRQNSSSGAPLRALLRSDVPQADPPRKRRARSAASDGPAPARARRAEGSDGRPPSQPADEYTPADEETTRTSQSQPETDIDLALRKWFEGADYSDFDRLVNDLACNPIF